MADSLADGAAADATLASVIEYPLAVSSTDFLDQTMAALESAEGAIPVIDRSTDTLAGWLSHQRVLTALYQSPAPAG